MICKRCSGSGWLFRPSAERFVTYRPCSNSSRGHFNEKGRVFIRLRDAKERRKG